MIEIAFYLSIANTVAIITLIYNFNKLVNRLGGGTRTPPRS